jgi:hypothetical protein
MKKPPNIPNVQFGDPVNLFSMARMEYSHHHRRGTPALCALGTGATRASANGEYTAASISMTNQLRRHEWSSEPILKVSNVCLSRVVNHLLEHGLLCG